MQAVTITQITAHELQSLIEDSVRKILSSYRLPPALSKLDEPDPDKYLTIEQAAAFLHLSIPTIYGHVSKAIIPCMKKGKRLYFSKRELTEWIKQGKKSTLTDLDMDAGTYLHNKKRNSK